MFDRDRWQEIFIAIKQNKVRSILTAFGVFWGILMLVVMTGSGNGLVNGITHGMQDFATNSAFMWTNRTTKPHMGFQQGRWWNFKNNDMEVLNREVPEIDVIAPRLQGWNISRGENVHRGLRSGSFTVNGDYPEYNKIDPNVMVFGRFINDMDIMNKRKVCIIGERVYETMFDHDEDPVGEYLKVSGVYFQVIGVFRSKNPNINIGSNKRESIYVPFTTMQQVYNYGDNVHLLAFTAHKGEKISEVADKVMAMLRERNSIAPDDHDAIGHFNVQEQVQMMTYLFIGINILIWIVGIGTLIAGAVGISNIMLVVVKERTKEIGVQRAIGAKPGTIISQVLTESVFLTTIAGFFGLAFGTLVLHTIDTVISNTQANMPEDEMVFFMNPEIGISIAGAAMIILIITGLVAGFIPARKAIRIKPIDAIRHE